MSIDLTPGSPEWVEVPGHAGYYASRDGRILGRKGRVLSPSANDQGYMRVQLGQFNSRYVHRIVAETFIGPIPDGYEVEHSDDDRANNEASNLVIVTHAENMRLGVSRHPNCRRGHPMRDIGHRRDCPTCRKASEAKRVRR